MMDRILSIFDDETRKGCLPKLLSELLLKQKELWPELKKSYETLSSSRIRHIRGNGFSVKIQHNPIRIKSTLAGIENGSPPEACFLCLERLPPLQKAILYKKEFMILCNPFPVFPLHFTVSHVDHRPQNILGFTGLFISIARDLGDLFTVLYNGAKCGASAKDHLHFQIIPASHLPIEREVIGETPFRFVKRDGGIDFRHTRGLSRYAILLEGKNLIKLEKAFVHLIERLKTINGSEEEPMMNSLCLSRGEITKILLFPRAKHRPSTFYKEGDDRILISPGSLEMAGFFVAPRERDFERLDLSQVDAIFREVSFVCDIM